MHLLPWNLYLHTVVGTINPGASIVRSLVPTNTSHWAAEKQGRTVALMPCLWNSQKHLVGEYRWTRGDPIQKGCLCQMNKSERLSRLR